MDRFLYLQQSIEYTSITIMARFLNKGTASNTVQPTLRQAAISKPLSRENCEGELSPNAIAEQGIASIRKLASRVEKLETENGDLRQQVQHLQR